jgi:hypothetical protein
MRDRRFARSANPDAVRGKTGRNNRYFGTAKTRDFPYVQKFAMRAMRDKILVANLKTPMKSHSLILFVMLSAGLVSFSGCATSSGLLPSRVWVNTAPDGSEITIDGQSAGASPVIAWLSPSRPHQFVAHREDWGRTAALLLPAANGKPQRLFIWSADTPLTEMRNYEARSFELWLRSPGEADPFSTYLQDVITADAMLAAGHLTTQQHRALLRALGNFFAPPEEPERDRTARLSDVASTTPRTP